MNHPTLPLPLMISSALSAQDLDSVHSPAISARRRALLMRRRDDPAP